MKTNITKQFCDDFCYFDQQGEIDREEMIW